jgi:tetratricopeptide (TPR) repeat protein
VPGAGSLPGGISTAKLPHTPNDWRAYVDRAEVYGQLGKSPERDADLERAASSGADAPFLLGVANEHAVKGRWDKAAERFAQASALGLPWSAWQPHALVRLKLRDRLGYRRLCRALLKAAGTRPDPLFANLVAWLCSVGPGGLDDYKSAATLAELAVANSPAGEAHHQVLNTLGAVYYRSGRYQDAINRLSEGQGDKPYVHDLVFLAMAHHQLGQAREAKLCLTKARAQKQAADARQFWQNLEIGLLLEEAEALLATPPRVKL